MVERKTYGGKEGLWWKGDQRKGNHVLNEISDPHGKGQFGGM